MKLPNFLIVGAAKCGTTSLYRYLEQHPDVFMPRWKELSLFIGDPYGPLHRVKKPAYYRMVFKKAGREKAVGEASTCYLYDPDAPRLIQSGLGDIKIIITLRNPVDMAYSLYNHQLRKEGEHLTTFESALRAEAGRLRSARFRKTCYGWHANYYYSTRGYYHEQVKRYLDTFGRENVKLFLFDDLAADPAGITREAYRFIGVESSFTPEIKIHNQGGRIVAVPRFWEDRGLLQKTVSFVFSRNFPRKLPLLIKKRKLGPASPIDRATAQRLSLKFQEDIGRLEQLIARDLSAWRTGAVRGAHG